MANIGQTIIIRTDLFKLPEDIGLLSAQVAHIHFETLRKMLMDGHTCVKNEMHVRFNVDDSLANDLPYWLDCPYLYVKQVPNCESLMHFYELALGVDLPVDKWIDTVYVRLSPTMKRAFPDTLVGISIGPADADKIRTVVGDLPLL